MEHCLKEAFSRARVLDARLSIEPTWPFGVVPVPGQSISANVTYGQCTPDE